MKAVIIFSIVSLFPVSASALTWSAGGWASASYSGGWPALDLRGRFGFVVAPGHELGFTAGILSVRLASQVHYEAHYTWSQMSRTNWPIVSFWLGGSTDVISYVAQTRIIVGTSIGTRFRVGDRVTCRLDLGHESLMTTRKHSRVFLAVGFEFLGGEGWPSRTSH